jgi:sulfoxide reductase heme-binding subunit YedZ
VAVSQGREARLRRGLGVVAWVGSLVPLAWLVADAFTDGLGADPIREVTHRTGFTALALLMGSLAVTPVRRLTGWNGIVPVRRTLGLCAFGYAVAHLCIYLFDQGFAWSFIVEDVTERPYVMAGTAALLLLAPLALTSTRASIRRLGRRWQALHRLVYLAALLGTLHFLWLVKKDLREPLVFLAVYLALMAFRLPLLRRRRAGSRAAEGRPSPASAAETA